MKHTIAIAAMLAAMTTSAQAGTLVLTYQPKWPLEVRLAATKAISDHFGLDCLRLEPYYGPDDTFWAYCDAGDGKPVFLRRDMSRGQWDKGLLRDLVTRHYGSVANWSDAGNNILIQYN